MSKIKEYETYFENLAKNYKPIGHTTEKKQFVSLSREEVMAGVRSNLNLKNWTLVLLKFDPKIVRNESRMFQIKFNCAFEIVKEIGRSDDKATPQDLALEMVTELVAVMLNQFHERTFPLGILVEEFDFYEVVKTFDTCIGYGVEFSFYQPFSRVNTVKAENWLSNP